MLLTDGHGSTRLLWDLATAAILQRYRYTADGLPIGFAEQSAGTTFLFGGDSQYNQAVGLYYHLARWRQSGGTRLTLDPYAGNLEDPLSLNKYLFVHGDEVNGIDPTGKFFFAPWLIGAGVGGLIGFGAGLYAGYQETGSFFSNKTLLYALGGGAAGALTGGALGATGGVLWSRLALPLFSRALPSSNGLSAAGFQTTLRELLIHSHQTRGRLFLAGFVLGSIAGATHPNLGLAQSRGLLATSSFALFADTAIQKWRARLPSWIWSAYRAQIGGISAAPHKFVGRLIGTQGTWLSAGFATGVELDALNRLVADWAIDIVKHEIDAN